MSRIRPRMIAVALVAMCVLAVLGITTFELLRDPLAELNFSDDPSVRRTEPMTIAERDFAARSSAADYVGSDVCAECHPGISETYQSHPMSRSVTLASASPDAHSGAARFTLPGPTGSKLRFEYRMSRDDDGMRHHEVALDAAGNELCSRTVEVHFAVGSGERGHSYFRNVGGQLYLSPMTWYAGARDWDLSPGYEKNNQHFERRVLDDCVFCHVGRAAPEPNHPHTFAPEPILEMGIGCERCHGPGKAHVSYRQSASESRAEEDPIVNPARLSQPFRDDVCFQCHLQGSDRLPHPGHRPFDFRPGQAVAEVWLVLMQGTKVSDDGTTSAVGQAEQMLASRCYVQSEGAMSCTSCHDPHGSPSAVERVDFYRSKCLACHASGEQDDCAMERSARLVESSEDSCIQCHMPPLDANDVPHTSQTDHRVVRSTGEGGDPVAAAPGPTVYELDRLSLELANRSRGVLLVHQSAEQAISLLTPWVHSNLYDAEAAAALGTAYYFSNDTQNALPMLDMALALDPDYEEALRQRMLVSHEIGDFESGIEHALRLIEVNPHQYEYHGRLAHMLGRAGRWNEAIDSALKAAEIRPWSAQIHGWLAEAYRITGQQQLSQKHSEFHDRLHAAGRSQEP